MRRLVILLVLAAALAAPGLASAAPSFVFKGHGWGHGIGMAQYGAYGFAQEGWNHERILAHYYRGTKLGPAPLSSIRVLLASGRRSLEIQSAAQFKVTDATGFSAAIGAGSLRLGTDLALQLENGGTKELTPPVRVQPGKRPLELGKPYRGSIVVTVVDGRLQAVNRVKLEKYLYGVVPGEMPSEWHPEALKTQAVAARSYALASRKTDGSFDVYADTRSQVYGGIRSEEAKTTAAVNATRGQVVLYKGNVAWTYFSASSGGRTAAIQHVWTDSEPVPYLVSVEDPHDDISPYHDWGPVTFTAEQLTAKLGSRLPTGVTALEVKRNDSGRVQSVTAVGTNGEKEISGWDMRMLLGLRSTWFTIEVVGGVEPSARLKASSRRVVFGEQVRLSGVARGTDGVTLELRPPGSGWKTLERLRPGKRGAFSTAFKPSVTTLFRVRAGRTVSVPVRVAVAPKLTLSSRGRRVAGRIEPRRASKIRIQQKSGTAWQTVTTVVAGENGAFRAELKLTPGAYRAWTPPSAGRVAGTSPTVTLAAA